MSEQKRRRHQQQRRQHPAASMRGLVEPDTQAVVGEVEAAIRARLARLASASTPSIYCAIPAKATATDFARAQARRFGPSVALVPAGPLGGTPARARDVCLQFSAQVPSSSRLCFHSWCISFSLTCVSTLLLLCGLVEVCASYLLPIISSQQIVYISTHTLCGLSFLSSWGARTRSSPLLGCIWGSGGIENHRNSICITGSKKKLCMLLRCPRVMALARRTSAGTQSAL